MREELRLLLHLLEDELRDQGRWQASPPSPEALGSTEPFAVDTLDFDQWLQWILLPRLNDLLSRRQPLPSECAIAPMAEEVYGQDNPGGSRIVHIVGQIDVLLTDRKPGPS